MRTNQYDLLRNFQQAEFDALPIKAAFGNEQFDRMMQSFGLVPGKDNKLVIDLGYGLFIQKKHYSMYVETTKRHANERKEAIAADKTGEGFIRDMFYSELLNHEFGYTGDASDAIAALGMTFEEIQQDLRLMHGLSLAMKDAA